MSTMEEVRRRVLLDAEQIGHRMHALAARLAPRLAQDQVTVVPILGGAVVFAVDLIRLLPPVLMLEFLRIQTYGDGRVPLKEPLVDWRPHPENIRGHQVLLLDDILDTGRTMAEAQRFLREEMGAAEVLSVVMVDKPARRQLPIEADDYMVRVEEDLFLVGCGLDYAGRYRNLPQLCALEAEVQV